MKIQFSSLSLAGTTRTIKFSPGFNLIHGPISTGKTSVLRLCRIALGSPVSGLPPEIRLLPAIGVEIQIGARDLTIYRPLTTGVTSKVEVLSGTDRFQLPTERPDASSANTFAQFLLDCLGLPQLRVPSAPTRPDSDSTPVSINDYMLYTDLPKEEIRSQVFGHRNPFKDVKRKYVFEILYGQYDIETARLQEQLREVRGDLRLLRMDTSAFERLLDGTPWSNRGELEAELVRLKAEYLDTKSKERDLSQQGSGGKVDRELRLLLKRLDSELSEMVHERKREDADIERFSRLASQLETQIGRLTRAIVANETLLDIEFVVCPRCGTSVDRRRTAPPHCYLCLQEAQPTYSKQDLVREQERLTEQLGETRELVESRKSRVAALNGELSKKTIQRDSVGSELDRRLSSFISDSASVLQDLSASRASLEQKIVRLQDYLTLFAKRDKLGAKLRIVEEEEKDLLDKLDAAMTKRDDVEKRIATLERYFTHFLRGYSAEKRREAHRRSVALPASIA